MPHEPCCFIKHGVIIFFYVDDIVVAYRRGTESDNGDEAAALEAIQQLNTRYKLTGGGPLQWFLGMEVIRDRAKGLLWLL